MKFLLSLLVLLFPLKGFSPHEGGGGNVCYYRGELVLLDEFYVDYGVNQESDFNLSPVKPVYREVENGEMVMDFTRMDVAPVILKTLAWYERDLDRDFFREFKDFFMALDSVYLKNEHFTEAWSPDGNRRINCARGFMRAMMVSTTEGVSLISTKDWKELHPQRKQIAMFHETLRLSQLHTSWFKDVLNEELSVLTMMIYYGALRDLPKLPVWKEITQKLRKELYTNADLSDLKLQLAEARKEFDLNPTVQSVSKISVLLKQIDIKENREPGLHFSREMKKLRAHPLYLKALPDILTSLRKL